MSAIDMNFSSPDSGLPASVMHMSNGYSERLMTAEELFVPSPEGFAPMARMILDQVTAAYPVDVESGDVMYGPPNPQDSPQKGRASHPYVHIELIDPGSEVRAFTRPDRREGKRGQVREYFVHEDALYRVVVTSDEEVAAEIRGRTHVRETHYSDDTGRVNIRVPRPEPHVQTYFPGGKK